MSHSGLVQWDEPLMKRIQIALDEHDHEQQTRIQTQASKRKKKRTYKELTKSSDRIIATATASSNNDPSQEDTQNEKEESDDSEDDIFQNVGTYVPPRIIASNVMTKQMDSSSPSSLKTGMKNVTNTCDPNNETKPSNYADVVSKGSIFSGLLPVAAPVPVAVVKPKARPNINQNQNLSPPVMAASHAGAAVIIDRDLFGLKGDPQESVPLTAEQGFSTTNYGGEYGEEMDEDEDDEEEEEQDKDDTHNDYKRKKTKDSLTMGAKDYGKRDNNKASHRTKNSTNDPEMM
eukprot:CAMPEP_0198288546 /NCGR_PEP_ID=MMETSP1449-20131203/7010_1 /TAXON_ID=420275 /ORGANISM="Attheya septentrionalis, Strain CCMP2084" /LENGTH=288 /DNA_ID=CAMNT_0043986707 /DNA_START=130 /DNA_END=996 /DNA_ORIENTATION=-